MATLNQSNKATAVFSGSPSLSDVISALTDLRDTTGASGSALLRVVRVDDDINGTLTATGSSNPILVFEWDATP